MSSAILKTAANGVELIEIVLLKGPETVGVTYKVVSPKMPGHLYSGPSLDEAEIAYRAAAKG